LRPASSPAGRGPDAGDRATPAARIGGREGCAGGPKKICAGLFQFKKRQRKMDLTRGDIRHPLVSGHLFGNSAKNVLATLFFRALPTAQEAIVYL
jgi:hypothetical protein